MLYYLSKSLKYITGILFACCLSICAYAQGIESTVTEKELGVVITEQGSVANVEPYLVAIKNANMGSYRLLDQRRTLKFDTGLEIELLSAQELNLKYGIPIDPDALRSEDFTETPNVEYVLHSSGYILEKHKPFKRK